MFSTFWFYLGLATSSLICNVYGGLAFDYTGDRLHACDYCNYEGGLKVECFEERLDLDGGGGKT